MEESSSTYPQGELQFSNPCTIALVCMYTKEVPPLSSKNSVALNTVQLVRRMHWTTLTPNQQNTVSMVVTPNVVVSIISWSKQGKY